MPLSGLDSVDEGRVDSRASVVTLVEDVTRNIFL